MTNPNSIHFPPHYLCVLYALQFYNSVTDRDFMQTIFQHHIPATATRLSISLCHCLPPPTISPTQDLLHSAIPKPLYYGEFYTIDQVLDLIAFFHSLFLRGTEHFSYAYCVFFEKFSAHFFPLLFDREICFFKSIIWQIILPLPIFSRLIFFCIISHTSIPVVVIVLGGPHPVMIRGHSWL